jgi:hypothetical protein
MKPVFVPDATIDQFINIMLSLGRDPMTCTALLAAAYLYIYDHGTEPGVSLKASLESFSATVLSAREEASAREAQ